MECSGDGTQHPPSERGGYGIAILVGVIVAGALLALAARLVLGSGAGNTGFRSR